MAVGGAVFFTGSLSESVLLDGCFDDEIYPEKLFDLTVCRSLRIRPEGIPPEEIPPEQISIEAEAERQGQAKRQRYGKKAIGHGGFRTRSR